MENEENNQSTQQQSVATSNTQLTSSSFLHKRIKHSFWLLWTVVGAFLITSIFISINAMIQVEYAKDEEPEITPVVSTPTATSSQTNSVPLWLMVAATLGCAAGAIVIAKRQKNLTVQPPQNQPPEPQAQLLIQEQTLLPLEENLQIYLVEELLGDEKTLSISEDRPLILVQELEVEENNSNANSQSLVDMLDIRKKLPLSAILGESYQQLETKNE